MANKTLNKAAQSGADAAYYRGQAVRRDTGYHYDRNLDSLPQTMEERTLRLVSVAMFGAATD